MKKFRYDTSKKWVKGNTHIHSTKSDGGKTYAELAQMYRAAGYDFIFHTDHWYPSAVESDGVDTPLLRINGIELDGHDYGGNYFHVVCLGSFTGISKEMGFVPAMEAIRQQGGLLILAHPAWTGNTQEDAVRWGFHGVEIYNHVCHWLNGKSSGLVHWNTALEKSPNTTGFSVDDAHISSKHSGWNGGWIQVNVPALTTKNVLSAIKSGNFYSSTGPEFQKLSFVNGTVSFESSPVQFARLVGPRRYGKRTGNFDGMTFMEGSFEIPEDWDYAYLEIEDTAGKRAWTNTLLTASE